MKNSSVLVSLFFIGSMSLQAEELKLRGLERFPDTPHQNDFLIKSDCEVDENSSYAEKRLGNRCEEHLKEQNYNLRLNYIKDFMRYLVYGTKSGRFYLEDGADAYSELYPLVKDRETSFRSLAEAECEMTYYCGGSCGAGDIDSGRGCVFRKVDKRSAFLDSEISEGIYIANGNMESSIHNIFLITFNYVIELKSECDKGLFLCEKIEYIGTRKSDEGTISLKGQPYFGRREESNGVHQLGLFFRNNNYEYYVDFNGTLEVLNIEENETLIKEKGVWRRNP